METIIFLDSIRSTHNVGSIFRTAEAAGVVKLLLGGYTPAPFDRFGREQAAILKTSVGASRLVPFEQVKAGDEVARLQALQRDGYELVAVEQSPGSITLTEFSRPEKAVYIFGNENEGVSKTILAHADQIVEIPMAGVKESLNVSVTVGVVLFH